MSERPEVQFSPRAILCRDLVINSVLVRVAQAAVAGDLERRTDTIRKQPGPHECRFEGLEYRACDARFAATLGAWEEVVDLPEPQNVEALDSTVTLESAMLRFRKIILAGAAHRALHRDKLSSAKPERILLDLLIDREGASLDDAAVVALVCDLLVAHLDHSALDDKAHVRLLGVRKHRAFDGVRKHRVFGGRLTQQSTLGDLCACYLDTLKAVVEALVVAREPALAERLMLDKAIQFDARDVASDVQLYRAAIAKSRQPSRRRRSPSSA